MYKDLLCVNFLFLYFYFFTEQAAQIQPIIPKNDVAVLTLNWYMPAVIIVFSLFYT